ncbi:hypothetical protein [Gracilimonas mengyeensis]|uniref:Capsule polysaccharide export protein KpsE/RkpR n=1 Tax=Gracilimonas mengyeensis TaxID=1302730 RepID=A0A521DFT3_9BACT|nr:hypothetical protein [Gracilimonas mengyeensis]SMO70476.1 Capsule polysaccharide export protein KpsE/RkpR [Gracilimonas mengyeensis]
MKPTFNTPDWADTFRYLYANKIKLFGIPFAIAVVIAIYTLFIPNRFTSTANLLPSQRPSLGFDLFSEEGGLQSLASSVLGGESEESNRYIILLSSYSTSKKVIDRFDLMQQYDVELVKDAIDILAERTTFESMEEGNFIISVQDESPEQAKEMAEYYVDILNELNTEIVSKDARQYRQFIEKRYNKSLQDIDSLKTEIIDFQQENGVFQLPDQVSEYFSLISGLTVKQLEAEIKLNLLDKTVQQQSNTYQNARFQLETIREKLDEVYSDTSSQNLILNFDNLSELGARYYELELSREIQTEIQKFLLPIYEQAKMEEAKSLPIVSVVDEPHVAEKKSYPSRSIIVIISGISAFFLVLLYFIMKFSWIKNQDYIEYLQNK